MKTTYLTLSLIFTVNILFSQIEIEFNSEFNYYTNQIWGDTSKFTTNSQDQLQLNDNQAGEAFIALENPFADYSFKEWKVDVHLNFSPSSGNYTRIYLYTQDSLVSANSEGLYLQFGESGNNDAIHLIWDDGNVQNLLSSSLGLISSSFDLKIRLNVDSLNFWRLYTRSSNVGQWVLEDSVQFFLNAGSSKFSVFCEYTSSNSNDFFFDNLYIGNIPIDSIGPKLEELEFVRENQLHLYFDEITIWSPDSKLFWDGIEVLVLDYQVDSLENFVELTTLETVHNLDSVEISIQEVEDVLGNSSNPTLNVQVLYSEESFKKEIIFNELMIDPNPPINLPDAEYIELYNRTDKCFNLENFCLVNQDDTFQLEPFWLFPNEFVVLCNLSDSALFSNCLGLSNFPSLLNSEDDFKILNHSNSLIDEIHYDSDFLQGESLANNGKSLALIYPNYFCSNSEHWQASKSAFGGTPGYENEAVNYTYDTEAPILENYFIKSSNEIRLLFNESLNESNSNTVAFIEDYTLINQIITHDTLELMFAQDFEKSKVLKLSLSELEDCNFNPLTTEVEIVVPEKPNSGDIVINEVLFNPPTGGKDFVELLNTSEKYIDLTGLALSKDLDNYFEINEYVLAPKQLVYLSEDIDFLQGHYPFYGIGNSMELDLPNFNNDSSHVFLVDSNRILDEVFYSEKMHFSLLEDVDGVSLERIGSNFENEFVSAASSYNFASPGVRNSQFIENKNFGNWQIFPKTFSPNNDGQKDFTSIYYSQLEKNTLFSIRIYNEEGILVKSLCDGQLGAFSGSVIWDGKDDKNQLCKPGNYLFLVEISDVEEGVLHTLKDLVILIGN